MCARSSPANRGSRGGHEHNQKELGNHSHWGSKPLPFIDCDFEQDPVHLSGSIGPTSWGFFEN